MSASGIVEGGIALATPVGNAAAGTGASRFILAKDEATATAPPDGRAPYIGLRFAQSLRGLTMGAPAVFSGINFGRVVSMKLDYDPVTQHFPMIVGIEVYPHRLGPVLDTLGAARHDAHCVSAAGDIHRRAAGALLPAFGTACGNRSSMNSS
ncbi:MlaD family protein (plasmid) [Paraburkholderia sp. D15]|nr:MlaD family protein [Paraburkholderia sp. D15]